MSSSSECASFVITNEQPQSTPIHGSPTHTSRSAMQFRNPPQRLLDDFSPQLESTKADDGETTWLFILNGLQDENQTLMKELTETMARLDQSQQTNTLLRSHINAAKIIQTKLRAKEEEVETLRLRVTDLESRQNVIDINTSYHPLDDINLDDPEWQTSDPMVLRLMDAYVAARLQARRAIDLAFQKRYLLLSNQALETCERQTMDTLRQLGVIPSESRPKKSSKFKWHTCIYAIIAVYRLRKPIVQTP